MNSNASLNKIPPKTPFDEINLRIKACAEDIDKLQVKNSPIVGIISDLRLILKMEHTLFGAMTRATDRRLDALEKRCYRLENPK